MTFQVKHRTVIVAASLLFMAGGGFSRVVAEETNAILGDVRFPQSWTVFGPIEKDDPVPDLSGLESVPETMTVGERTLAAQQVTPTRNQFDFALLLGDEPTARYRSALVFLALASEADQAVTLGLGGDHWVEAWLNGERIIGQTADENWPPTVDDFRIVARLRAGANLLAVRFVAGSASSVLALGGPAELRAGDFRSIAYGPFFRADDLENACLPARPGGKSVYEIGTRLELFVDEFMIDGMSGGAERRLHHPVPREVIMEFGDKGMPWESDIGYPNVIQDGERILLYYRGGWGGDRPRDGRQEVSCVIESRDGIHFTRPELDDQDLSDRFPEIRTSNVIWAEGPSTHNFTPFLDSNPAAPPKERFKAVARARHGATDGVLSRFVSPDGIRWRVADTDVGFASQPEDSQNLVFWDTLREIYVCYLRGGGGGGNLRVRRGRHIRIITAPDFVKWSRPEPIDFTDDRYSHMYTSGIRPYFRAPHIYIGTPNRFVPQRRKVPGQPPGINDTVLMSSRDGRLFDRWEEAFIRPGLEPGQWTNRNYYPTANTVQTSPTELSLYWTEHNRLPTARLRRGTLRLDGFVSVRAGGALGEMLTRPMIFEGNRLVVNYATSAAGSLRFELCDEVGNPIKGFTLSESEELFGNDVEHRVSWVGGNDLGALAGRPVRLRVRLHDADFYAFRFDS